VYYLDASKAWLIARRWIVVDLIFEHANHFDDDISGLVIEMCIHLMTLALTFLNCFQKVDHLFQLMVLILLPVNGWVGLGLFHDWFGAEVEVKPGTYTPSWRR